MSLKRFQCPNRHIFIEDFLRPCPQCGSKKVTTKITIGEWNA